MSQESCGQGNHNFEAMLIADEAPSPEVIRVMMAGTTFQPTISELEALRTKRYEIRCKKCGLKGQDHVAGNDLTNSV